MLPLLASALVSLCLLACTASEVEQPSRLGLDDLPPLPALEPMEPAVRDQFEERQALLVSVLDEASTAADHDIAWALGQMGRLHQAYRDYDRAVWFLDQAHRFDPEIFDWPYLLGHVAKVLGDLETAERGFLRAHELRPDEPRPLTALGELALEAGDLDRAEAFYREALDLDATLPLTRLGLARVESARGRHADAIEALDRLLAEQPDAYQVHYALADAYRALDRPEDVTWHLEAIPASNLDRIGLSSPDPWMEGLLEIPASVTAIDRRGRVALLGGRTQEAIRLFRRGIALDPDRVEARFNLGMAFLQARRLDEAEVELRQSLVEYPEQSATYRVLGTVRRELGDEAEALILFARAIELDSEAAINHLAMAELRRMRGEHAWAIEHYERVIALDPDVGDAHLGLARTYLDLGRVVPASEVTARGLAELPRNRGLQWLDLRARAARLIADPSQPIASLVLPENPRTIFELETAAMYRAATSDFNDARRFQQQALQSAGPAVDRGRITARLEAYQANRLPQWAWVEGEPVRIARSSGSSAPVPSRRR
ncbi:MAG: tetratricopeptide repeat protein [Acidobacteriota bacterium]